MNARPEKPVILRAGKSVEVRPTAVWAVGPRILLRAPQGLGENLRIAVFLKGSTHEYCIAMLSQAVPSVDVKLCCAPKELVTLSAREIGAAKGKGSAKGPEWTVTVLAKESPVVLGQTFLPPMFLAPEAAYESEELSSDSDDIVMHGEKQYRMDDSDSGEEPVESPAKGAQASRISKDSLQLKLDQDSHPTPSSPKSPAPAKKAEPKKTPEAKRATPEAKKIPSQQKKTPQPPSQEKKTPQPPSQEKKTPQPPSQEKKTPQPPSQEKKTPQPPSQEKKTPQPPSQEKKTPQPPSQEKKTPQPKATPPPKKTPETPKDTTEKPKEASKEAAMGQGRTVLGSAQGLSGLQKLRRQEPFPSSTSSTSTISTTSATDNTVATATAASTTGAPVEAPAPPASNAKALKVTLARPLVKRLPSGIVQEDRTLGNGPPATTGKLISVLYTMRLEDGKAFAEESKTFRLGIGEFIRGFDYGCLGMRVGGERTLKMPTHLVDAAQVPGVQGTDSSEVRFDIKLTQVN